MNFLTALGAFIVAFLLLNLVIAAGTAALLAAVVAVFVFVGYPTTRR